MSAGERWVLFGLKWALLLGMLLSTPTSGYQFTFNLQLPSFVAKAFGYETCDENYIKMDFDKLTRDLDENLFGQHLVKEKLVAMLKSHILYPSKKALVISMHGWTGSGKNYVTNMIINAMYKLGSKSEFVHHFSGRLHFPLSGDSAVNEYKVNLQTWVKGNVSACPESVFIFDEIDKVPGGVIDAVKPYLDYHTAIDGVDYRRSIFIFLSNAGANVIVKRYHDLWLEGIPREMMKYMDFEPNIRESLYKSAGAFKESSILEDHLVSLYLPFLPLEKEHVELCIRAEMVRQNYSPRGNDVGFILNEMEYFIGRFSISGCKRVNDQVSMLMYRNMDEL